MNDEKDAAMNQRGSHEHALARSLLPYQVLERDPSLSPGQREKVRTINRSGQYLLRLIDDILDISRIEAGKIELNPPSFNLGDLLDDLENLFRSRTDAKGLRLRVEREAGLPAWVRGDEGKLRQILVNLLGNAVKFTESGGVCLRARCESVAALPAELRRARREAVADGDTALLAQLLGQAQTTGPAAAAGLKALADRYDYGNLDKLLAGDGNKFYEPEAP